MSYDVEASCDEAAGCHIIISRDASASIFAKGVVESRTEVSSVVASSDTAASRNRAGCDGEANCDF